MGNNSEEWNEGRGPNPCGVANQSRATGQRNGGCCNQNHGATVNGDLNTKQVHHVQTDSKIRQVERENSTRAIAPTRGVFDIMNSTVSNGTQLVEMVFLEVSSVKDHVNEYP